MKLKLVGSSCIDNMFTKDMERVAAARQYRLDALADGWTESKPEHSKEPLEVLSHLTRPNSWGERPWVMHILVRQEFPEPDPLYMVDVSAWAPDALALRLPIVYNGALLRSGVRYCHVCDTENVDTVRYAFAGRCCRACSKLPATNGFYLG